MSDKNRFVAHVGLGYWGKNILRNLYELGILHSAYDSDHRIMKERKAQFPDITYADSFMEILLNPDIKAVAISSPAATHYQLVKQSLLAGKDVYVEKPLALTAAEGKEAVDIADNNKRVLMVGHILQYHPAVVKLKELILSGDLGRIQYIYSNRLNIGKLRTEENILWSFAPHDISVILMLLGEDPVRVSAIGGDFLNKGVYDTTMTTLEFRNGVKGHIFVSWLHPYKEQKLIVVGSKAMAVFDDMSKEKLFLYPHTIQWKEGKIPVAQKADHRIVPVESGEPLKIELSHFADCVLERKRPLTDGHEGLRVLKILESAEEAIAFPGAGAQPTAIQQRSAVVPEGVFVHETACVDEGTQLGEGTKIWHFSHILKGTKIGKNCIIGQNVVVGPDVQVGNKCKLQNNVSLYKGVILEEEVFCGPSCVFTNVYNPRAFIERKHEFLQTVVKRGTTIGANATIVCGNTLGRYAMIGAGALVKSDVPDYAIVAGVPARQIGWCCKCGVTLKFNRNKAVCKCGNEYRLDKNKFALIKEKN